MKKAAIISNISLIKTFIFNVHYFGLKSIFKPPAIVAKNVKFQSLRGKIHLNGKAGIACIKIGFPMVSIFDLSKERTLWNNNGTIFVNGKLTLGGGFRLGNSGVLTFGDNVAITAKSTIVCRKKITLSDDCLISWDVLIMDTDFHKIYDNSQCRVNDDCEIIIGKHCWIGCRSLVLKGSTIPNNSIIAAGSIVTTHEENENTIYSSFGRRIKENAIWHL